MSGKYITEQGDTWDMISYKVYGDEHYIQELMNANIAHIHVVIFEANVELITPCIEIEIPSSLPPWKRGDLIE
ncbi:MAG: tail protein X [Cellulosilyticaceae bacterium]